MAVNIKSSREIQIMRDSCKYCAEVFRKMEEFVKPGLSTMEINEYGEKLIRERGCEPNFLNYEGYPASICTSVNDVIVHGIPKRDMILKEGDIISLDAGLLYKGYNSDMARTVGVGKVSKEAQELMDRTKESFFVGIKKAVAGGHLFDISNAIADYIEQFGYGIVRELVGHGIGRGLHEEPQIPNYHVNKKGMRLYAGMTVCVEPMINLGTADVLWDEEDGWTVRTKDHKISAHYENTILITEGEPEILTLY